MLLDSGGIGVEVKRIRVDTPLSGMRHTHYCRMKHPTYGASRRHHGVHIVIIQAFTPSPPPAAATAAAADQERLVPVTAGADRRFRFRRRRHVDFATNSHRH